MINKKSNFKQINNRIFIIGIILVISSIIGTYMNKIWPQYQEIGINSINSLEQIYSSDFSYFEIIYNNIKSDLIYMVLISIFSILVVTSPISMIMLIIRSISIGYIINSTIIGLQDNMISMLIISITKNIIMMIGSIVLILVSYEYIKDVIKKYKQNNKDEINYLVKRHIINLIIILVMTVLGQAILNTAFIWIIRLFVK